MSDCRLRIILLAGFALRLVLILTAGPGTVCTPDSSDYIVLGGEMATEGQFVRNTRLWGRQPEIFRTPGYPAYLSLGHLAAGTPAGWAEWADEEAPAHQPDWPMALARRPTPELGVSGWGPGHVWISVPQPLWWVLLLGQALADVALVAMVYYLALHIGLGAKAALLAAGFQAASPLMIASSVRLLSDTFYAVLLGATLLAWLKASQTGRWKWGALAGLLLGLGAYTRPIAQVAAVVLGVGLLPGRHRGRRVGAFAAAFLLAIAPWVARNAVVADYPGFSSYATDAMYYFALPAVSQRARRGTYHVQYDFLAHQQMVVFHEIKYGPGEEASPGDRARWRTEFAAAAMKGQAADYAYLHLTGMWGVFLPGATDVLEVAGVTRGQKGTLEVLRGQGFVAAVKHYFGSRTGALLGGMAMTALLGIKYLGVLLCLLLRGLRRQPAEVWVLGALVVVTIILPGPFGLPRYRIPIEGLLSVAAAAGLAAASRRFGRGRLADAEEKTAP